MPQMSPSEIIAQREREAAEQKAAEPGEPRRRGKRPAFEPTMSERRIVQAMSSLHMGEEEICRVISSGRKLANGRAMLKARAAGKFYAALDNNAPWAIQAAMRNQSVAEEQPEPRRKRSHHSPKTKIGKPPLRLQKTPNTSRTSPRTIHRRKRINEALGYRVQGYTFEQIAKHMKVNISTAHGYVVEGINAIPLENARQALGMELTRLDSLLSAFYGNGVEGDLPAATMCLNIIDRRAKLLGLIPEPGRVNVLVAAQQASEAMPQVAVEFIVPGGAGSSTEGIPDAPAPPFPWQRQLPKPVDVPMFRDPLTGAWRSGPTE